MCAKAIVAARKENVNYNVDKCDSLKTTDLYILIILVTKLYYLKCA